jgi:PAS domain S-box-containing protein
MNTFDLLPLGLVFMNLKREIVAINQSAAGMLRKDAASVIYLRWNAVFPEVLADEIENDAQLTFRFDYGGEAHIVQKVPYPANQLPAGFVFILYPVLMLEEAAKELDLFRNLNLDLRAIFDSTDDDLHVTDGKGITLRVSPGIEKFTGYKESELVGKSVYQLEREGVFQPSTTRLVLEKNEKISMFQTTNAGRRLMVVATPIRDENGSIIRVVNASRDVTEESQLQIELERLKKLAEGYRQEIMNLRVRNELEIKIVFRSEQMKKVIVLAQRVSEVDSAALISGDFGVGKELVASLIHSWSFRSGKPFITVNCGAVPESVLKTELFGLESDASDGREGKFGAIEMTNDGTLFLDEVEAVPHRCKRSLCRSYKKSKCREMAVRGLFRLISESSRQRDLILKKRFSQGNSGRTYFII